MVKKNGLISENKTAIKNATNILSSSATKVSKSVSINYIKAVSLVTAKPKTSKNRKTSSNAAFTNSTKQPSSPYPTFFKPKKIKCSYPVVPLNPTDNYSTHEPCGKPLIIALDRTQWQENNILMASAIYLNRALPIFWILLEKKGASDLREQQIVLRPVIKLFKAHKLVIIGDREFHSIELAQWLHRQGVKFVVRQKKDTTFRQNRQKFKSLSQVEISPGMKQFLTKITLTQKKGFGRFNESDLLEEEI
jgi:hypothetical protein